MATKIGNWIFNKWPGMPVVGPMRCNTCGKRLNAEPNEYCYRNSADAAQGKQFQIYDGQTDTICTYHENEFGYAESDDPAYMGTGVCWRKDMMDKADFHIRSKRK